MKIKKFKTFIFRKTKFKAIKKKFPLLHFLRLFRSEIVLE